MSSFPDSTPSDDTITIPLTRGYETTVDAVDADLAEVKWFATAYGYAARNKPRPQKGVVWIHRIILSRIIGRELRSDEYADHINGDKLNNTRANLRIAACVENQRNSRKPKHNTSGFKGVTWHKGHRKWKAQISIENKSRHIGYFDTREKAHAAYCEAAKRIYGEFARFE